MLPPTCSSTSSSASSSSTSASLPRFLPIAFIEASGERSCLGRPDCAVTPCPFLLAGLLLACALGGE